MSIGLLLSCRKSATFCVGSATFIAGIFLVAGWTGVSLARDKDVGLTTAEQLIGEAARAKADGRPARAYSLLHQVVRVAPENSLARWQLGQVKVDGEWLSVEEAERRAEADPRQAKYRAHKEAAGESPQ